MKLLTTIRRAIGRALLRSIENPSTPLSDPDEWAWDALGAERSASGVRVNRKTALRFAPVWRAVNLISKDVGKLPLLVYRREGEGKARAPEHPAYRLLRRKPNAEMTANVWRMTVQAHVLLSGNGYSYIYRRGDATPLEIVPLAPHLTYPIRVNGRLWYVTTVNGEPRKLPAEDVIHIKGLGFDGLEGYPVLQFARESLGLGIAAHRYSAKYFSNNAEPRVVIEHPGRLSETAATNLRATWNTMHQGLDNAHKTAVLEEGMKINAFSNNARQAQLLETREFEYREVANWFGVPAHKVGDNTRTSFSSLEQENQAYLDESLDPKLNDWEEECHDKVLTEEEKEDETHCVKFNRKALVRADMAARYSAYTSALNAGWMNRDEVRALEDLNPLPNGEGQKYFVPLNMQLTDQRPKPTPAAGGDVPADDGQPAAA